MTRMRAVSLGLDRFSMVYLWALFIAVFGIWTPHTFLTSSTLHLVASQQSIAAMVALAVLIPLAAGHYDLSVGANANVTGIVAILLQSQLHWNALPAIFASVGIGITVGLVNAFVVVMFHVDSFIATLGMGSILAAVLVIVTGNQQPQPVVSPAFTNLTQFTVAGFQVVVLIVLALALIVWWFLDHTPGGRYIHAIGGNAEASRLSGIRVARWTSISLIAAGGLAGLAGVLFTSITGPSLSFGPTLLLPAFAAAFLGSTQLQPGRFNAWGTLISIYVLATGVEGIQLVSGQQWLNDMFDGVALVAAVAIAVSRKRSGDRARRRRRQSTLATGTGLGEAIPAGEDARQPMPSS